MLRFFHRKNHYVIEDSLKPDQCSLKQSFLSFQMTIFERKDYWCSEFSKFSEVWKSLCLNLVKKHWSYVTKVFRFLHETFDYYLCYHGIDDVDKLLDIQRFVEADWASDLDSQRSTISYVFTLWVGWVKYNLLSTNKLEYMVTMHATKKLVWL